MDSDFSNLPASDAILILLQMSQPISVHIAKFCVVMDGNKLHFS